MFGNFFGEHEGGCGGCGNSCNWAILLLIFCFCCGGKLKNFSLNVNPCCLILLIGLLFCGGGINIGKC